MAIAVLLPKSGASYVPLFNFGKFFVEWKVGLLNSEFLILLVFLPKWMNFQNILRATIVLLDSDPLHSRQDPVKKEYWKYPPIAI